jgi:AAA15 family ATPase/GTPase
LVKIFHSDKWKRGGSQLVFATHETTLMDLSVFRRDQIWFTDKDTAGASHLYSLYDFKTKPRLQEAIQKGYLTGRYGAIPLLTDIEGE